MSIERIFYCDWRDCEGSVQTVRPRPRQLFLTVTGSAGLPLHFCSWDCVLKHAAEMPPVEVIQPGADR
jgi:hypothetical protein